MNENKERLSSTVFPPWVVNCPDVSWLALATPLNILGGCPSVGLSSLYQTVTWEDEGNSWEAVKAKILHLHLCLILALTVSHKQLHFLHKLSSRRYTLYLFFVLLCFLLVMLTQTISLSNLPAMRPQKQAGLTEKLTWKIFTVSFKTFHENMDSSLRGVWELFKSFFSSPFLSPSPISPRRARRNCEPETGYDISKEEKKNVKLPEKSGRTVTRSEMGVSWGKLGALANPNCVCVCVCVCVYLVRSVLHISHLGQWEFSNLSWSVNSWLHRANDGCCLTVLYLQGLFQSNLCVWDSVLYPYASVFVETYMWIFLLLYCNRCVASAGTNQTAIWELRLLLFILSIWLEAARTTWGERDAFILDRTGRDRGFLFLLNSQRERRL